MSYRKKKTVWILGAGFSKPLGGPLLHDLLSHKGQKQAQHRFGTYLDTGVVYEVYADGLHKDSRLWEHAEEFLEIVDLAADPSEVDDHRTPVGSLLLEMISKRHDNMNIQHFRGLALKAIAAECSFDRWSDPQSEKWDPYLSWGETLTDDDTVITFNYDTVVEQLALRLEKLHRSNGLSSQHSVYLPGKPLPAWVVTNVLKLHGSLAWRVSTKGSWGKPYLLDGHWDDREMADEYEPLIGMPGATKSLYRKEHFDPIWTVALERIRTAEVIVFFGYRFPPSDAQSRSELLCAIKANKKKNLRVHIVLGPDVNHHDTLRLDKMLEVTFSGAKRLRREDVDDLPGPASAYEVLRQPLYVQDFMTIMDEKFLNG